MNEFRHFGLLEGVSAQDAVVGRAEPGSNRWLDDFVESGAHRLRSGLVARFGVEVGCEAHADAVAWAAEHADRLEPMANPLGYLFRVGQSAARRHVRLARHPITLPPVDAHQEPRVEPGLPSALQRLRPLERTAVVLVHSYGWTYAEVADLLDIEVTTVNNLIHRGMSKLRRSLGVTT